MLTNKNLPVALPQTVKVYISKRFHFKKPSGKAIHGYLNRGMQWLDSHDGAMNFGTITTASHFLRQNSEYALDDVCIVTVIEMDNGTVQITPVTHGSPTPKVHHFV